MLAAMPTFPCAAARPCVRARAQQRSVVLLFAGVFSCGGVHTSVAAGDGGGASDGEARATSDAGSIDAAPPAPTLITEPDQGLGPIYSLISSAKHSIDLTMYEFNDTTAMGLLTTAAGQGVTVRVILDQNLEKTSNTTAYNTLGAGKVQVHWANPTYAATHQKTVTVDGTTSAIMTLNFTANYYATSRDFAVITADAADVAAIETTFNDDFSNASITPPLGDNLVWSPTNSQSSLLGLVNGAKATLLVENEEMGEDNVVSALASAASRGIDVEVIMTASRSWDTNFATLVAAGVKVVTYSSHASLYIHAKVVQADYGTSTGSVFIGSENFSTSSLEYNRELGIITADSAVMSSINTTLTKDFAGGTAYP